MYSSSHNMVLMGVCGWTVFKFWLRHLFCTPQAMMASHGSLRLRLLQISWLHLLHVLSSHNMALIGVCGCTFFKVRVHRVCCRKGSSFLIKKNWHWQEVKVMRHVSYLSVLNSTNYKVSNTIGTSTLFNGCQYKLQLKKKKKTHKKDTFPRKSQCMCWWALHVSYQLNWHEKQKKKKSTMDLARL